jgi:uncharacterized protein
MPVVDGWLNVFRVSADDPVQAPDAGLRATHELFGGADPSSWLATTLDDALEVMDRTGTERALVGVTMRHPEERRSADVELPPLAVGLAACRRAPQRIRLVSQVHDVSSPHALARAVREHGAHDEVVAVGVFPAALACDLNDRRLYPAYSACIDLDLPVRINLGIAGPPVPSRHQHPELLEELLLDFPELTVIGCHMGHPYERLVIRLMMKFRRLHLMTSGYLPRYFAPELVRFMGSSRGVGRIMFGSDHPGIPLDRALDEARKLPISAEALDQYLGDALCEVLGWS